MKCNQCEMLSINGIACHEIGCPDSRKSICPSCNEFRKLSEDKETGGLLCDSCFEDMRQQDEEFNDNIEWRE